MQGLTKRWEAPPKSEAGQSLIERILIARGLVTAEERETFLDPKFTSIEDPSTLDGASKAAEILCNALKEDKRVLIFGDYDADGITASAVLYHVIAAATGRDGPNVHIPDRIDEGYGIRSDAIDRFAESGIDMVISVDCGITALDAAKRARKHSISLIITDHHKPREDGQLPDCDAIVHPSLEGNPTTPFAGVGVAYQLAWAFARKWSGSQKVTEQMRAALLAVLPLVAIGTIADMVPLVASNRILTRRGLQDLPATNIHGLKAIMKLLDTPTENVQSSHISFGIAPLLNAVGRLAHAAKAVDLLTHLEGDLADAVAKELATHNRKRQKIQKEIVNQASQRISEHKLDEQKIVVLQDDGWKRGVVGVAAGKCVESYYRPTILLSGEGEELVGSARSIAGFSMFDALTACKEHLETYGGHDMAAGVTVRRENYDDFVQAITAYANENLEEALLVQTIKPDVQAKIDELNKENAMKIAKLGPFGVGNSMPIVKVLSVKVDESIAMGKEGSHLSLKVGKDRLRCVWWGHGAMHERIRRGMQIDLVGKLTVNEYRGAAELELLDVALPSA